MPIIVVSGRCHAGFGEVDEWLRAVERWYKGILIRKRIENVKYEESGMSQKLTATRHA